MPPFFHHYMLPDVAVCAVGLRRRHRRGPTAHTRTSLYSDGAVRACPGAATRYHVEPFCRVPCGDGVCRVRCGDGGDYLVFAAGGPRFLGDPRGPSRGLEVSLGLMRGPSGLLRGSRVLGWDSTSRGRAANRFPGLGAGPGRIRGRWQNPHFSAPGAEKSTFLSSGS